MLFLEHRHRGPLDHQPLSNKHGDGRGRVKVEEEVEEELMAGAREPHTDDAYTHVTRRGERRHREVTGGKARLDGQRVCGKREGMWVCICRRLIPHWNPF